MTVRNLFKKYARDTKGQFAVLFAIAAATVSLGVAVAVDTSNLHKIRMNLDDVADAAALAGASASENDPTNRLQAVKDAIEANAHPGVIERFSQQPDIQFDDTANEVTVKLYMNADTIFSSVLGAASKPVSTQSIVTYGQTTVDPVSISLVLDVSGSMGWPTTDGEIKINALKDSVQALFLEIENQVGDPEKLKDTMRTGMSTYNTVIRATESMGDGWNGVRRTTQTLTANGGTNATDALEFGYNQIINDRAYRRLYDPTYNPATLKEFVIFMTDGDNNRPEWDDSSYDVCQRMKNEGIKVFTVAFAAPAKGQALLLDCASNNADIPANQNVPTCRNGILNSQGTNIQACHNAIKDDKDEHFFDAADAEEFRDAFREIGKEIVEQGIRIRS